MLEFTPQNNEDLDMNVTVFFHYIYDEPIAFYEDVSANSPLMLYVEARDT